MESISGPPLEDASPPRSPVFLGLKIFSWVTLALMVASVAFGAYLAAVNWSAIGVQHG